MCVCGWEREHMYEFALDFGVCMYVCIECECVWTVCSWILLLRDNNFNGNVSKRLILFNEVFSNTI